MQEKKHPSDQEPQVTPGGFLRKARLEQHLTIDEVADATKISGKNIRAIESASFAQLPADTFVRGLVTIYGNFLGLDGARIAKEFLQARQKDSAGGRPQNLTLKKVPPSTLAPKKLAEPAHISSATLALTLLFVILVSFTGFCLYTSWNPLAFLTKQSDNMQASIQKIFAGLTDTPETPRQDQASQQEQRQHEEKATELPVDNIKDGNKQASYQLNIHFLKNGTVTFSIDSKNQVSRAFKSGEIIRLQAAKEMKLEFSQPEAATLTLNGKPLSFPAADNGSLPTLLIPNDLPDQ